MQTVLLPILPQKQCDGLIHQVIVADRALRPDCCCQLCQLIRRHDAAVRPRNDGPPLHMGEHIILVKQSLGGGGQRRDHRQNQRSHDHEHTQEQRQLGHGTEADTPQRQSVAQLLTMPCKRLPRLGRLRRRCLGRDRCGLGNDLIRLHGTVKNADMPRGTVLDLLKIVRDNHHQLVAGDLAQERDDLL